jgi:hypothetical protein
VGRLDFARRAKVALSSKRRMEDHRSSPPSLRGETYDETAGVLKSPPAGMENCCSWSIAAIQ